ncbi:hypothetical protein WN944_016328 [Citrus x changshan-huyou]|uniref:Uncharacterized protein n=1 Tax=Citrus x changshan-huyou TaxID=2935761 RepID=A0AAP0QRW9_9ROSI
MDRSSDPTMNMARASAFFASLAAKLSSNLGELRLHPSCLCTHQITSNEKKRPISSTQIMRSRKPLLLIKVCNAFIQIL